MRGRWLNADEAVIEEQVIPVLTALKRSFTIHETTGEADGIRLGTELYASSSKKDKNVLVIGGGDGTAHEVIEGILKAAREGDGGIGRWELVVLPLGTVSPHFPVLTLGECTIPFPVPSASRGSDSGIYQSRFCVHYPFASFTR